VVLVVHGHKDDYETMQRVTFLQMTMVGPFICGLVSLISRFKVMNRLALRSPIAQNKLHLRGLQKHQRSPRNPIH
jgi:hypothetical protein